MSEDLLNAIDAANEEVQIVPVQIEGDAPTPAAVLPVETWQALAREAEATKAVLDDVPTLLNRVRQLRRQERQRRFMEHHAGRMTERRDLLSPPPDLGATPGVPPEEPE